MEQAFYRVHPFFNLKCTVSLHVCKRVQGSGILAFFSYVILTYLGSCKSEIYL